MTILHHNSSFHEEVARYQQRPRPDLRGHKTNLRQSNGFLNYELSPKVSKIFTCKHGKNLSLFVRTGLNRTKAAI